mmetsp:Transcript_37619/g.60222  ORF Transcript_37619/g.60222 Transcript_37619/m.60222 type:complete len:410 (-) Transcript_37619:87-1316(-)|eukprot:CAMPEP_0197027986 /NCGR_PEP_ID=MMETSP1384-20130603/7817_1 /TAXON_ID=29189 /ORGANISM="Ammonia sp." /LENGTH=409 /DNA_ID=CAMNT_0042456921 /DNA_START=47 /DNA_END=1276 /DNA_ORIENTATION=+
MSQADPLPRCYIDFKQGNVRLGRVIIELFADTVPKTCENFRLLCTGIKSNGKKLYYKNSVVHRVIDNFMIQMGDFTNNDGTGGCSIYGERFEDENFKMQHKKYYLSMANAGKHTNGSQFFICTGDCDHLNGKHVVFGRVVDGQSVIDKIEKTETNPKNNRPLTPIVIAKCGQLKLVKKSELHQAPQTQKTVSPKMKDSKADSEQNDESDSHSESASSSTHDHSEHDEEEDDSENSDDAEDASKKKQKKKKEKEFHLDSVNFVDKRSGRKIKGKGSFKYFDRYASNNYDASRLYDGRLRDRTRDRERPRDRDRDRERERERTREQERGRERERERERERARQQEDDHETKQRNSYDIEILNAYLLTIENDDSCGYTVSSLISRFDEQDLQSAPKRTQSRSRSRSRSRSKR